MEIDAALTADLVLVALHDRDLQQMLGQSDAKVGAAFDVLAAVLHCSICYEPHQVLFNL
jgi:glycerophosphoryl diester phosphodiesterase